MFVWSFFQRQTNDTSMVLVPLDRVDEAWQLIVMNALSTDLVEYFINNWFEDGFSKELWNQAKLETPRTNNGAEGFHHKINRWVAGKHPTIYKLIKTLQIVDYQTSIVYSGRKNGNDAKAQSKIVIDKERKYKNILDNLQSGCTDLESFLTAASFLISFKF